MKNSTFHKNKSLLSVDSKNFTFIPLLVLTFSLVITLFFNPRVSAGEYGDTDYEWNDSILNSNNTRKNENFGTNISSIDGSVTWKFTDFYLPQNGIDIKIGRTLNINQAVRVVNSDIPIYTPTEIFDWSLNIPKIHLNLWRVGDSLISECGQLSVKSLQVTIEGVSGFDPIGMDTENIDYPEDTVIHFENNWLLLCSTYSSRTISQRDDGSSVSQNNINGVTLLSPDGTSYYFSLDFSGYSSFWHTMLEEPKNWEAVSVRTLYVTDIVDKYENWLAYDYKEKIFSYNDSGSIRKSSLLLTGVRSKEGTKVALTNDGSNITGINYGDTSVEFIPENKNYSFPPYSKTVLAKATTLNGEFSETWNYIHEEFGEPTELGTYPKRGLVQIKNPWGGVADFKYQPKLFGCSRNHNDWPVLSPYMSEYTTSGVGLTPNTIKYEVRRNITKEPIVVPLSDFAYTTITHSDRTEVHKYHCKEFDTDSPYASAAHYRDTSDIRDHRYKSIEVFNNNDELIRKTEYEWQEQVFSHQNAAEYSWYDRNGPNRLVKSKTVIDGEYETTDSNLDSFGNAQLVHENHIPNSRSRYHKFSFLNDQSTWLIGLPSLQSISSNNVTFTDVGETTYHTTSSGSPEYAHLGLVYENKSFGSWVSRYVSYHADGNLKKVELNNLVKDANGADTLVNQYRIYSNYKLGLAQSLSSPDRYSDSNTFEFIRVVDGNGRIIKSTDLEGNTIEFGYDQLGQLKYVDPVDPKWKDTFVSWSVNGTGQSVKSTTRCDLNAAKAGCKVDSALNLEEITYDGLLRPLLTYSSDLSSTTSIYQNFMYNEKGQKSFESFLSDSAFETGGTTYQYDELSRLVSTATTGGGSITNEYLSDNKIKVTDAKGNITTSTFLAYGFPDYGQPIKIESPEEITTDLSVNLFGNVESITQSGSHKNTTISQTQYMAYDSQQRLCKIKRNDVGQTVFSRNAMGEVVWQAQGTGGGANTNCVSDATAAQKITLSYDNLGELSRASYGDGTPDVIYTLDNNGDLTKLVAGGVEQNYIYNSARLLTEEDLSVDDKFFSISYGINSLGHLESTTYPNGDIVSYAPNGFGQATKATRAGQDYATAATYYPTGSIDTFKFGNGLTHKTTLNSRKVPSRLKDSSTSITALDLNYQYDNNLNITSLTDGKNSSFSLTSLTYDDLDRLKTTTGNSAIGSSSIAYDAIGNITSYSSHGRNLSYSYDLTNNILDSVTDSVGSKNFDFVNGYDSRGNVINNGTRNFNYNLANQMTSSGSNSYVYDGHNRRVKQEDSKGTTYSFYNQSGSLLYREQNDDGINYIFLGSKLIAKDGVIPVSTSSSEQHYRAFGETIETPIDDVGYTGHKFDTDLNLSYMQARYYDPVIGRFYSNDPVTTENVLNFNRYTYANNNPYKYIDPDGRESITAIAMKHAAFDAAKGVTTRAAYASQLKAPARAVPLGRLARVIVIGLGEISDAEDGADEDGADEDGNSPNDKNANNQYAKRNKKEKNKNNPNKRKTQRGDKNVNGNDPEKTKAEEKASGDRRSRKGRDQVRKKKKKTEEEAAP